MTKEEVLHVIKPMVISDAVKTGIPASLTAAQMILESGWLRSGLTRKANNAFGIKGSYKGASYACRTKEWVDGKYIEVIAKFKKYPSLAESIADHSALLCKPRYAAVRAAVGYKAACKAVAGCGYATAPDYAASLIKLIEQYRLDEWDRGEVIKDEAIEREIKAGDVVRFLGGKHYISATGKRSVGGIRRSGAAKVTAVKRGALHPYHLIAVSGGGSNVYGWCDAGDIVSQ